MSNTKLRSGVVGLLLIAGGFYAISHYSTPDRFKTITREQCVQKRTSNKKMRIALQGTWGGEDPATISYSVEQNVKGPFDHPAPEWQGFVYVRVCDLIILHVTPTNGEGRTRCAIHRAMQGGTGTYSIHEAGGPVQCTHWYENLD